MIPFSEVHWSEVRGRPVWRWATVTATSPTVSVTVDGDDDPIGVPPTVLGHVGPVTVGTRVWCQVTPGAAVVAIGRAGVPLLRPLVLTGGWTDNGAGWAQPTFMVDAAGFVRLDGMVRGGTSTTIATLPPGARPVARTVLIALAVTNVAIRVDVDAAGQLILPDATVPLWLSLSGLSFPAAR